MDSDLKRHDQSVWDILLTAGSIPDSTLLFSAVIGQDTQRLVMLLNAGADPNKQDNSGKTPLHWAVVCRHYFVMDILLKAGAKPTIQDNHGESPLYYALDRQTPRIFDHLMEYVEPSWSVESLLIKAADEGSVKIAMMLLDKGADVNALNGCGQTALHRAVLMAHVDMVKLLVSAGADLFIKEPYESKVPIEMYHDGTSPPKAREEIFDFLQAKMGIDIQPPWPHTASSAEIMSKVKEIFGEDPLPPGDIDVWIRGKVYTIPHVLEQKTSSDAWSIPKLEQTLGRATRRKITPLESKRKTTPPMLKTLLESKRKTTPPALKKLNEKPKYPPRR